VGVAGRRIGGFHIMANEIPSVRRLRGIGGVTPFRSVFDRPGVPMYTEEQFLGRGDQWRTPVSPVGYGTPRPAPTVAAPTVAAQYGLGSAREAAIRQAAMGGAAQRPQVQQRPAGFFDSLPSPMSPAGQALGAAATTGLQLSGWQDRPITLGQGLGAMAQAGMQAYAAAAENERQRIAAQQAIDLEAIRYRKEREFEERKLQQERELKEREIEALKGKVGFERADKLRDEVNKQSADYDKVESAVEKVIISGSKTQEEATGADDLALLFGYMKLLDPGSVVRESEFRQAQTTSGIPDAILALRDQILQGTKLTPVQRTRFVDAAKDLFTVYTRQQRKIEDFYTDRAIGFGVDPSDVVRSRLSVGSIGNPYIATTEDEANAQPDGSFVILDGKLYRVEK